jgi:SAM-dependent methyltransferase
MDRETLFGLMIKDMSGVAVEVGTCWGGWAEFLANKGKFSHLICIDPYKVYPTEIYNDALNTMTQAQCDQKFKAVEARLCKDRSDLAMTKIILERKESEQASLHFTDNSVSFVYIDGNHHYSEVLKDLCFWWIKVKPGGLLAGDDVEDDVPHKDGNLFITHQPGSYGLYGVRTALVHFKKLVPEFNYVIIGRQFFCIKQKI